MKTIRKALLWSIGVEVFAMLLVFGGRVGLSVLTYLALVFHFPALYLVDFWPAARQTLVGPLLIQWFIWFIVFAGFFGLRRRFQNNENHAA